MWYPSTWHWELKYSLVQWNWLSVTGCMLLRCIYYSDVREPISLHHSVWWNSDQLETAVHTHCHVGHRQLGGEKSKVVAYFSWVIFMWEILNYRSLIAQVRVYCHWVGGLGGGGIFIIPSSHKLSEYNQPFSFLFRPARSDGLSCERSPRMEKSALKCIKAKNLRKMAKRPSSVSILPWQPWRVVLFGQNTPFPSR